jgi:hypothetical protein
MFIGSLVHCHTVFQSCADLYAMCNSRDLHKLVLRNLSGSDGRLRKDKRQKCKKAGVRWAGRSGGDAQQPPPPPASLLYTVANEEVG